LNLESANARASVLSYIYIPRFFSNGETARRCAQNSLRDTIVCVAVVASSIDHIKVALHSSRLRVNRKQINDSDDEDKKDVKMSARSQSQGDDSDDDGEVEVMFSSQVPELSQNILPVKDAERSNLLNMTEAARERACNDMTRLVLFKALAGEPINRAHCTQEANIPGDHRVSTAVFEEVSIRLKNAFDFELKRIPAWMEKMKALPKKYKDRYYLINALEDDGDGRHSKAIHTIHEDSAIEKGLLMVILSLAYCKGEPRNDGSRWILDKDLYSLLARIDENIPSEPPAQGSKRRMPTQQSRRFGGGDGVAMTPDVDVLLDKFASRCLRQMPMKGACSIQWVRARLWKLAAVRSFTLPPKF
jgi:hypothetical protein